MLAYIRQARVDIAPPGIGVDRLRISFEIRVESQGDPSPSTIAITNLAESTVAQLVTPATVRLSAGYRGHPLDQVFSGQTTRIEHPFEGRDRLSILTLGGTNRQSRTAVILTAAYQGVVSLRAVVADIVQRLGLPVGPVDAIPDIGVEDYVYAGKAQDALTSLLRPRGVEWYEVDGEMRFRRRGVAPTRVGFVLSEATGMIGSPERTEKGVRARMRLNALVHLDQRVQVDSQRLRGVFKVITITHTGDTWDGEWQTAVEAVTV